MFEKTDAEFHSWHVKEVPFFLKEYIKGVPLLSNWYTNGYVVEPSPCKTLKRLPQPLTAHLGDISAFQLFHNCSINFYHF